MFLPGFLYSRRWRGCGDARWAGAHAAAACAPWPTRGETSETAEFAAGGSFGVRRPLRDMVHRERYDMSKYMSNEDVIKYLYSLREATVPIHSASRAVEAEEKK